MTSNGERGFVLGGGSTLPSVPPELPAFIGDYLGTRRAETRGNLGAACLRDTVEVAAALAERGLDGAIERLVEEKLRVGAALGQAVRNARHAYGRRLCLRVDTLDRAGERCEAAQRRARAAVFGAV